MNVRNSTDPRPALTGVYIHLPYCDVKCAYCDFYSLAKRHIPDSFWREYSERLVEDLAMQFETLLEDVPRPVLASVFFGGGTPSKAPPYLFEKILQKLQETFSSSLNTIEVSAEANPESLTPEVAKDWKSLGVNRVSVGMQSLDKEVLHYLGRLFNPKAYSEVFSILQDAKFTNINADFITGVPGQSVQSTLDDIEFALKRSVSHLSLYQLTVEDGTLLKSRIRRGLRPSLDDAMQVKQMQRAAEFLRERGFHRYEISNFAKPGTQCRHNLLYWTNRPYLGLGVSAHTFTGTRRFFHARSLDAYLSKATKQTQDTLARPQDAFLNLLRLTKKVHPSRLLAYVPPHEKERVLKEIEDAVAKGYWQREGALLRPTRRGLRFSDALIFALWNAASVP